MLKRYGKIAEAILPYVESIKRRINLNKRGLVKIKTFSMGKKIGMKKRNPKSIHAAVKYVLFFKGIVVGTGTNKSGEPLLVMRNKRRGDKLPPHMARY